MQEFVELLKEKLVEILIVSLNSKYESQKS